VSIDSKYDGDPSLADIGVVYLYRFAEGELPVQTFLDSYRAHPAGIEHDLHVIFKGFPDRRSLTSAKALFVGLPINAIELEDKGYDIGSYFSAAKVVSNLRLIFFNTFTELLADDWLKKFDKALSAPGVGLVGATGSWQSHSSGYEAIIRRVCHRIVHPLEFLEEIFTDARQAKDARGFQVGEVSQIIHRADETRRVVRLGRAFYYLVRVHKYALYLFEYGRYPNPHIRTNAFMIERRRFLSLQVSSFETKSNVYKFESGRRSMTKQIIAQGLKPIVVDRGGNVYDISEWKTSSTFWVDQQTNLIIADNRTRDYAKGSHELRARLTDSAWIHPAAWVFRGRRLSAPK
jgi:hypothetical protein